MIVSHFFVIYKLFNPKNSERSYIMIESKNNTEPKDKENEKKPSEIALKKNDLDDFIFTEDNVKF